MDTNGVEESTPDQLAEFTDRVKYIPLRLDCITPGVTNLACVP